MKGNPRKCFVSGDRWKNGILGLFFVFSDLSALSFQTLISVKATVCRRGINNKSKLQMYTNGTTADVQGKRGIAACNSRGPTMSEPNHLRKAPQIPNPPKGSMPAVEVNNVQTSRNPVPRTGLSKTEMREKRLQQRLIHVWHAWDDFQETRDRDAVYEYLRAVFSIVQHYRWKGRTKKLIRRAFKFGELPFDKNADPFTVIIRCACEQELDRKTISKWSRALRYVARVRKRKPLKEFMKGRGGINACADLYAKRFGRGER